MKFCCLILSEKFNYKIDFVFICHDPRAIKQIKETSPISRSRSARHESSTSDDNDDDDDDDDVSV